MFIFVDRTAGYLAAAVKCRLLTFKIKVYNSAAEVSILILQTRNNASIQFNETCHITFHIS